MVVPISAQNISFAVDRKLSTGDPRLPGEVAELRPAVCRRIVGVDILVDGQSAILGVAMAEPDIGDAVNAEIKRMVAVPPSERRMKSQIRGPTIRGPQPVVPQSVVPRVSAE